MKLDWKPNLLKYKASIKSRREHDTAQVFCPIRKQWLMLQPEEIVRQLVIHYLTNDHQIRLKSIQVEKQLSSDNKDRIDLAVYNQFGKPFVLVECKAWNVPISTETLNQISRYNLTNPFQYLWVSNGIENYIFQQLTTGEFIGLDDFPLDYI